MPYKDATLKVFTCNANPDLAYEICKSIDIPMGDSEVVHFSDGEIQIRLNSWSRRFCNPTNLRPSQ